MYTCESHQESFKNFLKYSEESTSSNTGKTPTALSGSSSAENHQDVDLLQSATAAWIAAFYLPTHIPYGYGNSAE